MSWFVDQISVSLYRYLKNTTIFSFKEKAWKLFCSSHSSALSILLFPLESEL